jgi:hypothetical protein
VNGSIFCVNGISTQKLMNSIRKRKEKEKGEKEEMKTIDCE